MPGVAGIAEAITEFLILSRPVVHNRGAAKKQGADVRC